MSDTAKSADSVQEVERSGSVVETKHTGTVDTVHNDEALKVLEGYTGDAEWTDQEEKKLRRKIDWRLMPVLCMTYGLQYYDKAMLSQAVSSSLPPYSYPQSQETHTWV